MIISFAWTTDALLAGRKKVTRRDWSKEYAARFHTGTVHAAYDRLPRVHGKKVGDVVINRTPYPEWPCDIPDEDYELEGFAYMEERGLLVRGIKPREFFNNWRSSRDVLFVVRFELIFKCDRCEDWAANKPFGNRLCPLCLTEWGPYSARKLYLDSSTADYRKVYSEFCRTERK